MSKEPEQVQTKKRRIVPAAPVYEVAPAMSAADAAALFGPKPQKKRHVDVAFQTECDHRHSLCLENIEELILALTEAIQFSRAAVSCYRLPSISMKPKKCHYQRLSKERAEARVDKLDYLDVSNWICVLIAGYARDISCRANVMVKSDIFSHFSDPSASLNNFRALDENSFTDVVDHYPSTTHSRFEWNGWVDKICTDKDKSVDMGKLHKMLCLMFPLEQKTKFQFDKERTIIGFTPFDEKQPHQLVHITSLAIRAEASTRAEMEADEELDMDAYARTDAVWEKARAQTMTKAALEKATRFANVSHQLAGFTNSFSVEQTRLEKTDKRQLEVGSDCEDSTVGVSGEFDTIPMCDVHPTLLKRGCELCAQNRIEATKKALADKCSIHKRQMLDSKGGCLRCIEDSLPMCPHHTLYKLKDGICRRCVVEERIMFKAALRELNTPSAAVKPKPKSGSDTETDHETNAKHTAVAKKDSDATETESDQDVDDAKIVDSPTLAQKCEIHTRTTLSATGMCTRCLDAAIPRCVTHTTIKLVAGKCRTCMILAKFNVACSSAAASKITIKIESSSSSESDDDSAVAPVAATTIARAASYAVPDDIIVGLACDDDDDNVMEDSQGTIHID